MFAFPDLRPRARELATAVIHRAWEWVSVAGCVGPHDAIGKRFRSMGEHSCLCFPPGSVYGEAGIEIGSHTLVGPFVTLAVGMPGAKPPSRLSPPVVVIGNRCSIGRGSAIVGVHRIEIGDDVAIAPGVYITDHNHSYQDVHSPIAGQAPAANRVRIGAGSWLGTGVVVLPGSDVGANVTVAAGAVVRGTIPDRCVVAGTPARVVRRYTASEGWQPPIPTSTAPLATAEPTHNGRKP